MTKITKRKFLKTTGQAGIGIISLRSGAAFAATSNSQCETTNQLFAQNTNPDPLMDNNNFQALNDPWLRAKTSIRLIRNKKKDLWIFQDPSMPGNWYAEDDNTRSDTVYKEVLMSGIGEQEMTGGGQKWSVIMGRSNMQGDVIAIYDKSSGDVVGFGLDTERSNITQSCYASINQGII